MSTPAKLHRTAQFEQTLIYAATYIDVASFYITPKDNLPLFESTIRHGPGENISLFASSQSFAAKTVFPFTYAIDNLPSIMALRNISFGCSP